MSSEGVKKLRLIFNKPTASSEAPASSQDGFFKVDKIIEERGVASKKEYKVVWLDKDEEGNSYPPSWVAKDNVTDDLVTIWNAGRSERVEEKKRRALKLLERRSREKQKKEQEKQRNEESRASRVEKREQARKGRLNLDGARESSDTAQSSVPSPAVETPPVNSRRKRSYRVIEDPEDAESVSTPATHESAEVEPVKTEPAAITLQAVAISRPEGISTEDYEKFSSSFRTTSSLPYSQTTSAAAVSQQFHQSAESEPQSPSSPAVISKIGLVPDSQSQNTGSSVSANRPSDQSRLEAEAFDQDQIIDGEHPTASINDFANNGSVTSSAVRETPARITVSSLLIEASPSVPQNAETAQATEQIPSPSQSLALPLPSSPTSNQVAKALSTISHSDDQNVDEIASPTPSATLHQGVTAAPLTRDEFDNLYRYIPPSKRKALEVSLGLDPSEPAPQRRKLESSVSPEADVSRSEDLVLHANSTPKSDQENAVQNITDLKSTNSKEQPIAGQVQQIIINNDTDPQGVAGAIAGEVIIISSTQRMVPEDSILQDAQVTGTLYDHLVTETDSQETASEPVSNKEVAHNAEIPCDSQPSADPTGIALTDSDFTYTWPQPPADTPLKMTETTPPPRPETPSELSTVTPMTMSISSQVEPVVVGGYAARKKKRLAEALEQRRREQSLKPKISFDVTPLSLAEATRLNPRTASPTTRLAASPSSASGVSVTRASPVEQPVMVHQISDAGLQADITRLDAEISTLTGTTPSPSIPSQDSLAFFIPITLTPTQKTIYDDLFKFKNRILQQFVDQKVPTTESMARVESTIEEFYSVAFHTDLLSSPSLTQEQYDLKRQAEWDVANSEKFAFLQLLITRLKDMDIHLVMFVKKGRTGDKVESFLRGNDVTYTRPDKHSGNRSASGSLRITIVNTHGQQIIERGDLVIGLDESFSMTDPQVVQVRKHMLVVNKLCPVISLVPVYTMEHIARTLSPGLTHVDRLRVLILQAVQVREKARTTSFPDAHCGDIVAKIVGFLIRSPQQPEILPKLNDYEIPALDQDSQTSIAKSMGEIPVSDQNSQSSIARSMDEGVEEELANKRKRGLDNDGLELEKKITKKHRTGSPTIYDEPSSTESRVVDSDLDMASSKDVITDNLVNIPTTEQTAADLLQAALAREANLQARASNLENQVSNLQGQVSGFQAHVTALESSTIGLRKRYDEQSRELDVARTDLGVKNKALATSETRHISLQKSVDTLKAEIVTLRSDRDNARKDLLNSANPDVQEMEQLRAEARKADELKRKLETQQASHRGEFEFLRENYQKASRLATEHAETAKALEAENVKLKEQATGHTVKLREMYENNALRQAISEADRMKQERDDARKMQQSLAIEVSQLKEKLEKRAGMSLSTRAGSQPPKGATTLQLKSPGGIASTPVGGHAMVRVPSALREQLTIVTGSRAPSRAPSRASSRVASRAASRNGSPAAITAGGAAAGVNSAAAARAAAASAAMQEKVLNLKK